MPIENLEGETTEEFKNRVIKMLNNSTEEVIKDLSVNVSFK